MSCPPPRTDGRARRTRSGKYRVGAFDDAFPPPTSAAEVEALFPDDCACRELLERLRWPGGFRCPSCHVADKPQRSGRGLLRCTECETVSTAASGTVFDRLGTPLRAAFRGIWQIATRESSPSSALLAECLGVDPTGAERWLEQIRRALGPSADERLCGVIELATFMVELPGGPDGEPSHGHLVAAVERRGSGMGHVRLGVLSGATAFEMVRFAQQTIAAGSCVCTDAWKGYARLRAAGFGHLPALARGDGQPAATPLARRLAAVACLWLYGTAELSPAALPGALHELSFRLNQAVGSVGGPRPGGLFMRLLKRLVRAGRNADGLPVALAAG